MNKLFRAPAGVLIFLSALAPFCYGLKTETLFDGVQSSAGTSAQAALGGAKARSGTLEVASGRIFVRFKAGTGTEAKKSALAAAGFGLLKEYDSGWTLASLPGSMSVSMALTTAKSVSGAEAVKPSRAYRVKRTPNDPMLNLQYSLLESGIDAVRAWEYNVGSSNTVTVAVIDTGIDSTHPDLSGKFAGQGQFFNPNTWTQAADQPSTPACSHATYVAGAAAAATDNAMGIAGVSWGAGLLSLKVFDSADCTADCGDSGSNFCTTDDNAILAAVNYAMGVNNQPGIGKIVVNMSLGNPGACDPAGPLQDAINNAHAAGLLMVAATGNDSAPYVDSPASCDHVIAVGATDSGDNLAVFPGGGSNYGVEMTRSGLVAPGKDILSTGLSGAYDYVSGTSFSAPIVSGLAALVWSARPGLSNLQVWDVMKNSADELGMPGADQYFGFGRVNAYKALQLSVNGNFSDFQGNYKAYAYPNPFRPATEHIVSFTVPSRVLGANLELKIYTQEGELVKQLSSPAWNGRNEGEVLVASGVYLFYLKTDRGAVKGKFAVIR